MLENGNNLFMGIFVEGILVYFKYTRI